MLTQKKNITKIPGSVMAEELGVVHTAWQKAVTGLSRFYPLPNIACTIDSSIPSQKAKYFFDSYKCFVPREELLVPAARALAGLYR